MGRSVLIAVALCLLAASPSSAFPPQEEAFCFAVADSGDNLVFINKDGDGFLDLGATGTGAIEAIAFNPDDGDLYAVNGDDFGRLDYDDSIDGDGNDSEFVQISPDVGTCTLPGGGTVTINDIDGLQFDFTRTDASTGTFVLWASVRDGDGSAPDDVLVQIDPNTGLVDTSPTPGFTGGATCVRISGSGVLVDIDDIAVDATDGTIYGVNNLGGATDKLVIIDPVTGAATVLGPFLNVAPPPTTITDMEGLSFGADGTLYGTTGGGGTSPNDFWRIDTANQATTMLAAFPSHGDYEAVACLTDNLIEGRVFFDVEENGSFDPMNGDTGFGGARIVVYIDENDDGTVDGGDTQLCENPVDGFNMPCPLTAADGTWSFPTGQGSFVSEVDLSTLPVGHRLTTDNREEADFGVLDFGVIDPDNDYGFVLAPQLGDLDLTKTSDAAGAVTQGQTVTYTIVATNNTGITHTEIEITDILPAGVAYVPQSTVATGPIGTDTIRVTEYFVDINSFPGTTFDLVLDQDLVADYFVIIQGSDGDGTTGNGRGPDENYARLVSDPFGTGDLAVSSGSDVIRLERDNAQDPWVGVVTVVEALADQANSSFSLLDVQSVLAPNGDSTGSDTSAAAWSDINQTMLMGGFNGAGCTTPDGSTSDTPVCHWRIFPSGTNTINWSRNTGDGNDNDATSTVMVVEWGSEWNVQRVRVQGNNGGNGVDSTSEYDTATITSVARANTWVWGTGFTNDNGAGDAAEGSVITLGDGVSQNATESTVAVGSEFSDTRDFEVYALTHDDLRVDYRFKADGDQTALTVDVPVDQAVSDRMALSYNGLNSTATGDYPRSMFSARYIDNSTVRLERRRSDDEFPAWIQGIDFSGILLSVVGTKDNVPGGANPDLVDGVPPGVVEAADSFVLRDGDSLTVTLQVTVDDPLSPFRASLLNLAVVDSTQSALPEVTRHVDPVASGALGDRVWMDVDGDGVQDVGEPGLPNVEVTLFDAGPDGMPGGGDDVALGTQLTGANGLYLFAHLAPGTYFVDVTDATVPTGLAIAPGSTDPSATFTVTSAEIFLTADFGYANADGNSAILGDYIWNDMDRDGIQDPGEIGIGGVTVELVDVSTGLTVGGPVTTTADGKYLFTGVAPGEYEVRVTDTGGVLPGSSPTAGPQSEGSFVSAPVTVIAGQVVDDLDFGFAPDACLPRIDFEIDASGAPLLPGQILDDEWGAWGVAFSTNVLEPIVFGSSDPTGGDLDLGTPNETCTPAGPGVGAGGEVTGAGPNCFPQEHLVIVAENLVDGNGDGLVDNPDDRGAGGIITVDFASTVEIEYLDFVDAEEANDVTFGAFNATTSVLGDNAFENFPVNATGTQLVVDFPASGAIGAIDFCLGSLRDKLWLDANGDGLFDVLGPDGLPGTGDEELPIGGVTVDLLDASGAVIATTITDANGNVRFDGLGDGDYTIVISDTSALLNPYGGTTAPALAEMLAVTVTGGADVVGINFGYNAPGEVGDTVFTDPDGDGVQDPGEAGIAGVTVELWADADGDGAFDNSIDTLVATQVTAADGSYLFQGLSPATYFSSIDNSQAALTGYTPTTTDEETGGNAPGTQIEAALVGLGDSFLDADFGYFNSTLADISGTVFEDLDRDGVEEPGENGFAGVTVELRDCSGNVLAATVSDANGDYAFADLPAGCYEVTVTDDFGVLVGYALTSGLDTLQVTLGPSDVGDVDFGYARDPGGASIGDSVWLDENGDGLQSAAEAGLSGVAIDLWLDDGDGVLDTSGATDTLVASTVTDANGEYNFPALDAGNYFVDLDTTTLPANLTETTYPGGFDPADLIPLSESEDYDLADFGYVPDAGTVVLGDRVWYDTDGNGLQDPGEIGIAGVIVQIVGPGCAPCTVTTGPDGSWLATNLPPGDYAVTYDPASLPAGYGPLPTNLGGQDTYNITVVAGDLFTHLDFGFNGGTTGSIGTFLWFDDNGDGDVDAGEIGIEGVTVNLVRDVDGNGVIDPGEPIMATVRTDAAGGYLFSGLPLSDSGDGDSLDADYLIDVTDIDGLLTTTNKTLGLADTDNNSQADPYDVVLTAGSPTSITADFGYAPSEGTGSIGSQVWHDVDLDGLFEPLGNDGTPGTADDESGFQGVTVQLWLDDGDGSFEPFTGDDNLLRSVTTDANGEYEFDGLPASVYFVTVSDVFGVLTGFEQTRLPPVGPFPCPGADDESKVDPCIVTLTAGSQDVTADFGYAADPLGDILSISGTVFEDQDADGTHDEPGEPVVEGATVRLYLDLDGDGVLDPSEPLIGTTFSDVNGDYIFDDLPPGDYLVATDPAGTAVEDFVQTTQTGSGGLQPVTLVATDVTDQDFGFWSGGVVTTPVTLAGFEAVGGSGGVTFRWTTATEVGNVGFNIWSVEQGGMKRVNRELIRAQLGDSLEPQSYVYEASGFEGESFVLEDRDLYGRSRYHGPFRLGEARGRTEVDRRPIDWQGVRRSRERRRAARTLVLGATAQIGAAAGAPVELRVERDGIHRVTYEQLLAAGADYAGVPVDELYLSVGGEATPIRVVGSTASPSLFGDGGYFDFVGERIESLYTRTAVYTLEARAGGARFFEDGYPAPPGIRTQSFYMETHAVENQSRYHFAAPGGDPWYEASLLATSGPVEGSFPFDLEGWVEGAAPVTMRVEMWGVTDFPQAPDHHVVLEVNASELADEWFDGLVDRPVELAVPDSVLSAAGNELRLLLPHDTGAEYDLVNYDGLEVTYPRHFRARDGALSFESIRGRAFRVDGLPSADVVVYQMGDALARFAAAVTVDGVPGDYSATFTARRGDTTFFVASAESLLTPAIQLAAPPADITSQQADLVIVSHGDFVDAIEPLAQARRDQGFSVLVADVADVYRQFSFGVVDPQAITDYLAFAASEMGTEYALLVGGDTYDYFDYLGTGSISFIPTPYAQTDAIVHFAPVDSLYVDADRDGVVEMALGRLPVRTVEELAVVVAKTLDYDDATYRGTAVLAADGVDLTTAYSFTEASEEMRAQLPGDWQTEVAYIDDLGVDAAHDLLVGEIDRGVALTSYFGHSGPTVWSFDRLFDSADADALDNPGSPTVVAQWGCWNTYHVSPGFDTLGHVLMLAEDRGAAAVLGAATLTEAVSERKLGREVFGRIGVSGVPVGRAVLEAKQALAEREPGLLDVLWGWTLLGDPTLVVQP